MENWLSLETSCDGRSLNRLSIRSVPIFNQPHDPAQGHLRICMTVQAIDLIEEQSKKIDQRIDALLLVGGFSGSEYFFGRVKVRAN